MAGNPYLDLPPLGETPAPAKDANPYLALDKLNDEGAQLRATLSEASRSDPAQARQADVLAKKQALPQDVVLRNLRDVSMQNAVDEADRRLKTAPDLFEKFRTQPFFAKQAQDDLDALIAAHGELKAWKGPEPGVGSIAKGLALALPQGLASIRESLRTQVTDLMEAAGILEPDPIRAANDARRLQQAQDASAHTSPAFESATAQAVYGGASSAIQQAPGLLAGILTGSIAPGLALIGLQQYAQSYGKYRLRGGSPLEATVGGALEGAIEVGTEMIPMKFIVSRFGKAGFGEFVSGLFGREVLTEQLATAGEDFVDYAVANPEKTLKQYLEERPGAAYQTLVSTITQSLLMGGAGAIANRLASDTQKQQWADEEQKKLATLFSIAATSKLKTDNPVSFAQTIQEIADKTDGAPKSVFVDARALVEMQQTAGLSDEVFFQMLPSARDKIAEALVDNGVVELPIGEVTATVPGSKIEQAFMQQVRMDPTAPNEIERTEAADKAEGYLKSESDKVIAEAEDAQKVVDSADVVRQTVVKQLEATKRFKPEVAQRYADLHAAFFTVLASRLGATPEQAFQKYGASIRSTLGEGQAYRAPRKPGEVTVEGVHYSKEARNTLSGAMYGTNYGPEKEKRGDFNPDYFLTLKGDRASAALGQRADQTETAAFKKWFGKSNLVNEDGSPMVLYHGTQNNFEAFRTSKTGAMGGPGVYLGDSPEVANNYAGDGAGANVVPVYARGTYIGNTAWSKLIGAHGWEKAREVAIADGISGVWDQKFENAVLVWDPANIKSAIGNRGTFDPNDPSILAQNKPDPLGTFKPSTLEISLLADANLSTFLHETGHFFLEVLGRVASEPGAPKEIVDDLNATLKWFGVESIDAWNAMTFDEREPHHEKWAESFERYLLEGKAPSPALRQSFQRFKEFLLGVYKSLKQFITRHPNAKINDEIRSVFDRLLATEEQIKEAEAQARFEEIFKSAKDAGMTEDEWKAYQAQHQDATQAALEKMGKLSLADTKWFVAARSKALREAQAAVADKRAEMKAQVTAEVMALPVEQARAEIANLRASTPEQKAALKTWNEARAAALAQAKEELTAALVAANPDVKGLGKGQLLAKNKRAIANQAEAKALEWEQSHPRPKAMPPPLEMEVLAERLGYTSADHLRREMIESPAAKDLIEAMTDQRLLETYGNLVTREGIEQAANEAVYNEARGRFVATELGAMQDAMSKTGPTGKTNRAGKPVNVNVITQAARTFAEAVVNRRRIMDLKPAQHTAAAARAAGKAARLQAEGKTAEAIAAKRDQLLSHFTALYAFRAEKDVASQLAYLRKFEKEGVRKSIPQDYLDQIDALLEKVDLRKGTSAKEIERRKSLAAWVEEQHEEGKSPILPPAVLANSQLTSYKEMTVEDFAGLVDSIQNIEHLGRLKGKLLKSADKREWDAIATEIADTIRKFGGKAKPDSLEPRGKAAQLAAGFWADHRKLDSLAYQMDGGQINGPMFRAFIRGMNDSGAHKASEIAKATQALAGIYAPIWSLPGGTAGDLKFIPEINNSLTRGGRLAVALNWGNAENRQRLLETGVGAPWSQAQVEAILRTLSPTELQFVNNAWEFLDSFWPAIKAKQQRVSGVVEEKVEAVPFDVVASDGTTVHMRGGYYPIVYDNDRSNAAAKRDALQIAKDMLRGAIGAATTRRGHTKARVEEVKAQPLRLSLNVITQHVEQVVHDLAWHEWLIDANKILADKRIAAAIREHYGPEILKTMKANVDGIATGDVANQTALDQILLGLRSNVSRAVMGFSLTTGLLQPFGVTQSISRVGLAPVLKGAGRWAGDAARMESTIEWVKEKSDFMRLRAQTMNREINDISQRVKGKSKAAQIYDHSIFFLTQKMQLVADIPTWVGMYERAQAEGFDEATSVALADEAVKASQGGGQTQDLANIQRSKMGSLFTMFYGYFSTTVNIMAEKTAMTDFKSPLAVAGWLADMTMLAVLPAILPNMLIYAMRGGDDDDPESWAKRLAKWQAAYMLGLFVGVRELSGITEGYDYAGPPVLRVVVDTGKAAKQLMQGELDEAAVASIARVMGDIFGIPSTQLIRSYRGWQAWADGDAPITAVLMGPPPRD